MEGDRLIAYSLATSTNGVATSTTAACSAMTTVMVTITAISWERWKR